jgi:hypothetical protein
LTFGGEVLSPVYHLQLQLRAERRRQAGWRTVCAGTGAPRETMRPGGELVCGPPGAHLEPDPVNVPEQPEPFVPIAVPHCSRHPFRVCVCGGGFSR